MRLFSLGSFSAPTRPRTTRDEKTFKSVERAMKGIGDMFDEFGDRVVNLGEYVQEAITGIVGGVGQVLQDITQGVEDIVGSLLAPCPKPSTVASEQAQQALQADVDMFDTDIEIVHGNIVGVNSMAQTTGTFTRVITEQATNAVTETTSMEKPSGAFGPVGPRGPAGPPSLPLTAPPENVAFNESTGLKIPDAVEANAAENKQREELEQKTTQLAKDNTATAIVDQVVEQKKQGEQEETKKQLTTTDETGENVSTDSVFDLDTCTGILKKFGQQLRRILNLSNSVVESDKTFFDGSPTGVTEIVDGFWAVTSSGIDNLMMVRTRDGEWHATLSRYKVLQALNEFKETGKWPKIFLQNDNRNYGVIEPKYLDNLKKAFDISVEILGEQYLKKLRPCIDEDEEKLKQAAIDSLDKNSPNYKTMLSIEQRKSDRSGREFLLKQIQSFHDRFLTGGEKKLQKWGNTTEYKIDRSSGPLYKDVDTIVVDIGPAIAASGSGLIQSLNSSD